MYKNTITPVFSSVVINNLLEFKQHRGRPKGDREVIQLFMQIFILKLLSTENA
jgi:hypothetical protein